MLFSFFTRYEIPFGNTPLGNTRDRQGRRDTRYKIKTSKKSVTLIELIMTILIVSIISIPLSVVFSQYIRSYVYNEDLSFAQQFGRMEQEKIWNIDYDSLVVGITNFPAYEGFDYDVTRNVTYQQGGGASAESLKRIEVTVFPAGSGESLTQFVLYRARNVSF